MQELSHRLTCSRSYSKYVTEPGPPQKLLLLPSPTSEDVPPRPPRQTPALPWPFSFPSGFAPGGLPFEGIFKLLTIGLKSLKKGKEGRHWRGGGREAAGRALSWSGFGPQQAIPPSPTKPALPTSIRNFPGSSPGIWGQGRPSSMALWDEFETEGGPPGWVQPLAAPPALALPFLSVPLAGRTAWALTLSRRDLGSSS